MPDFLRVFVEIADVSRLSLSWLRTRARLSFTNDASLKGSPVTGLLVLNVLCGDRYAPGKVVWECERIGRFYSRGCLSAAGLAKQPGRKQCHTDKRQHGDESNLFHYGKILGERRDGLPSAQRRQVYG